MSRPALEVADIFRSHGPAWRQAHAGHGRLSFFGDHAHLADAQSFAAFLAPLRKAEWVVYSKRPFGGPQAVLAYRRLITFDKQGVTFK